jgi:DNA-binding IclR family transcriptional regulator
LVKSADRVLEILEFCARQRHPVTHAGISTALGLPISSASALLGNLVDREYLAFRPDAKGYTIGASVIALASAYLRELDLPQLGQDAVQALAAQLEESAALAVLAGKRVQVVARHNWVQPLMYSVQIGDTAPLHASASGKAILAFLPPKKRDVLLSGYRFDRYASGTLSTRRELIDSLSTVRDAGFAYVEAELVEGIVTLAAPVFDVRNDVVGALSISQPTPRLRLDRISDMAAVLCRHAKALSRELGARTQAPHSHALETGANARHST